LRGFAACSNVAAVHFDVDCGCFYVYYFNIREKKQENREKSRPHHAAVLRVTLTYVFTSVVVFLCI
jgi:hypothetical protein